MLHWLMESGLYNTTFLLLLGAWVWVGLLGRPLPPISWNGWRTLTLLLLFGTIGNLGIGLYKAYVAPRDVLQDIVSGYELLHGRAMNPPDMNQRMQEVLEEENNRRTLMLGAAIGQAVQHAHDITFEQHWVQAHPPLTTILFAGIDYVVGILGAQMAMVGLSIGFFVCSMLLIRDGFPLRTNRWVEATILLTLLGWNSIVTVFRNGQWDLILVGLLIASWSLLRQNRPTWAGFLTGLAICLKLVPGLILVVFLLRHRHALVSSLLTILIVNTLCYTIVGHTNFICYLHTTSDVVKEYAAFPSNVSLLGWISRGCASLGYDLPLARSIWYILGGMICLGMVALLYRQPKTEEERQSALPLEFGLAMSLIPLCSPVAWDHYLTFLLFPIAVTLTRPTAVSWRLFWTILLIFSIPETTYLNLYDGLKANHLKGLALWIFEPLRTYAMILLTGMMIQQIWQNSNGISGFGFWNSGLESPNSGWSPLGHTGGGS